MASLKDIALKCGVSVASVSKALNGYADIGEDTRELVIRTAKEMGYIAGGASKTLKTKRGYNLGIILEDESFHGLTHDYFNKVIESFKVTAESKGYDVTITSNNIKGHKMSYIDYCKYRNLDGILLVCIKNQSDNLKDLVMSDIPLVAIDYVFEGKMAVLSDNVNGIEELVTYIVGKGHKKIAYIHGQENVVTRKRLTGFYRTMQKYGLDIPDEYIKQGYYREPDTASAMTRELMHLPDPPTCILYSDDYAAMGGVSYLREHGYRIPYDVSIAGYDAIDVARILEPKLATISQNTTKIGQTAANALIEMIENPKTTLIQKFTIPGELVEGKSVRQL